MLTAPLSKPAVSPVLGYVFTVSARIGPVEELEHGTNGRRRRVPILGGSVSGARLSGAVRPGGVDNQLVRPDHFVEIDAAYEIESMDGAIIAVRNRGLVSRDYARTTPVFAAPDGPYAWLTQSMFVADLALESDGSAVRVNVFAVR